MRLGVTVYCTGLSCSRLSVAGAVLLMDGLVSKPSWSFAYGLVFISTGSLTFGHIRSLTEWCGGTKLGAPVAVLDSSTFGPPLFPHSSGRTGAAVTVAREPTAFYLCVVYRFLPLIRFTLAARRFRGVFPALGWPFQLLNWPAW
ncbi:unnamed protein product, partial [Symbiodinium necroappetens]